MTGLYFHQDLDKALLPNLLEDITFKAPFTFSAPTRLYGESDPDDDRDTDSDNDSDIEPLHLNDEPYIQVGGFSYPRALFQNITVPEAPPIPKELSPPRFVVPKEILPPHSIVVKASPATKTLSSQDRALSSKHKMTPSPKHKARNATPLPSHKAVTPGRNQSPKPIIHVDSDDDESGDFSPSDDDYTPSPSQSTNPKKRSRSVLSRKSAISSSNRSDSPPFAPSAKRQRIAPPSRNIQSAKPDELTRLASVKRTRSDDFTCPECGWTQGNKRSPDFARHLKSHARPTDDQKTVGWWCKGVLVEEGAKWRATGKPFLFADKLRVGGCGRSFSRRDALKRHLDNSNITCIGDAVPASEEPKLFNLD